jgi:hypothetical protein
MGNECKQYFSTPEQEITTAGGDDDYDPSIRELKVILLKKICYKNDYLTIKNITNEEFDNQLKNKPKYYRIMNQLKSQLRQISFDEPEFQNVCPFKIINHKDGEVQYYKGSYDFKGECTGEGIWLNNYNIYYGNFRNDTFNGEGVFMNTRGDYYFGEWENGVPNGHGMIVFNGMKSYEGEFRDGQKCGQGIEAFPDGDYYKGEFMNGQREGRGRYTFGGGSYYEGNLKNSKFDGEGVFNWSNGQKYSGQFNNGKMNGHGTFQWNDGSSFTGYYSNNTKQGEGEYKWANGSALQSNWINNQPNGNSTFLTKGFKENISYKNGAVVGSVIPDL